jgi:hypothetical protein
LQKNQTGIPELGIWDCYNRSKTKQRPVGVPLFVRAMSTADAALNQDNSANANRNSLLISLGAGKSGGLEGCLVGS